MTEPPTIYGMYDVFVIYWLKGRTEVFASHEEAKKRYANTDIQERAYVDRIIDNGHYHNPLSPQGGEWSDAAKAKRTRAEKGE